jgi:hypothetical protein
LIILKKAIDVVTDALMTAIWRSGSQLQRAVPATDRGSRRRLLDEPLGDPHR